MCSTLALSFVTLQDIQADTKDNTMALLRMIYQTVDGERQGDIAAYMSSKTSPEIREYIRQNILMSQPVQASQVSDKLDDDMIAQYTRDASESSYEYASRMRQLFEHAQKDYDAVRSVEAKGD